MPHNVAVVAIKISELKQKSEKLKTIENLYTFPCDWLADWLVGWVTKNWLQFNVGFCLEPGVLNCYQQFKLSTFSI